MMWNTIEIIAGLAVCLFWTYFWLNSKSVEEIYAEELQRRRKRYRGY